MLAHVVPAHELFGALKVVLHVWLAHAIPAYGRAGQLAIVVYCFLIVGVSGP